MTTKPDIPPLSPLLFAGSVLIHPKERKPRSSHPVQSALSSAMPKKLLPHSAFWFKVKCRKIHLLCNVQYTYRALRFSALQCNVFAACNAFVTEFDVQYNACIA